jgi:nucleoside phosphorylase
MIAVTFAHPSESRDFLRLVSGRHHEVEVFHTGVGAAVAARRIEGFLDSKQFDLLISSGFAGGIDHSLGIATLFVAENFSDPTLLEQARKLLICRIGKLLTADRVIENPEERAAFAREQGADAVDMETEQIATACAARKIPLLSLRAISDTAAKPFPAPASLLFDLEQQRTRFRRLAPYLLTRPAAVVRLARFARQIAAARAELAIGLKELIEYLS